MLPSRNDSFGMVVPEALASGTPVLVSDRVGAPRTWSTEGKNGWIVPVDDAGALADRMAWCAGRPGAVRAMRPACRRGRRADWPLYLAGGCPPCCARSSRGDPA